MRAIPIKMRQEMASSPFYKRCCVSGKVDEKIEFHHNLIFGGRQVNEKFCILPLAKSVHEKIVEYKEICNWIMCNRATTEELQRYSKAIDYVRMKQVLNDKYGGAYSYQGGTFHR